MRFYSSLPGLCHKACHHEPSSELTLLQRRSDEEVISVYTQEWLCTKDSGRIGGKNFSRAKAQRRKENFRKRGSALRLCARNILGKQHFFAKALRSHLHLKRERY